MVGSVGGAQLEMGGKEVLGVWTDRDGGMMMKCILEKVL